MIIEKAAFIFDLLTNKLSRSKAFKTIQCSKRTNRNRGGGLRPILDCYSPKNISDCNQSVFLKKNRVFLC